MSILKDISFLNEKNKNLINHYFPNISGQYFIENNFLNIEFDNWGKEKFFISNEANNSFYNVKYENVLNVYNIGISIQIGNWDFFKKMEIYINNLKNININYYFVLIKEFDNDENINYLINNYHNNSTIIIGENKGMDIGLFLISLHYIKIKQYKHDYLIKIHTKTNDDFRNETLKNLFGSYSKIIDNIKLLSKENNGMISGNIIYSYNSSNSVFQSNLYHIENLVKYIYDENIDFNKLDFSGGTMFIAKFKIFNILNFKKIEHLYGLLNDENTLDYYWYSIFYKMNINNKNKIEKDYLLNKDKKYPNNINYNKKTNKPGLRDCMIEHALERILGYLCKKNNLNIVR